MLPGNARFDLLLKRKAEWKEPRTKSKSSRSSGDISPSPCGFRFISIERSTVRSAPVFEIATFTFAISVPCRFSARSSIPPAIFNPLGVVGDCDILVETVRSGLSHFCDFACSIAATTVHLQITARLPAPRRTCRGHAPRFSK